MCDVHYACIILETIASWCVCVFVCVRHRDREYFSLKDPECWLTASSLDTHKPLLMLLLGRKCSQICVATCELCESVCLQVMISLNSTV